jgi:hypothetical protein
MMSLLITAANAALRVKDDPGGAKDSQAGENLFIEPERLSFHRLIEGDGNDL